MPLKHEVSEDQNDRRNKRQKIQHIRSTKAACLEEERQADLVDAIEEEVRNEDATSDIAGKYEKVMMEIEARHEKEVNEIKAKHEKEITEINAKYDTHINEARAKLSESRRRTQRVRKGIRDAGGAEFDSLLRIGDDSLSRILTYLDMVSIGRCDKTCKSMKLASKSAWHSLEKQIDLRYASSFGDSAKEKFLRFFLASKFARRAESQSNKHQIEGHEEVCMHQKKPHECNYCGKMNAGWQIEEKEDGDYEYDDPDEEWDEGDDDSCCFPDTLNKTAIKSPERFEMFMRVTDSKVSRESKVLFEGFIPQEQVRTVTRRNGKVGLDINFRGMEFPKWQDMERSLSLDIQKGMQEWLKLSHVPYITLLAVPKQGNMTVNSLSSALMGCFGHANTTIEDELGEDEISNFEGFGFENDIYHVRVGSVTAAHPHEEREDPCRYMFLASSKDNGLFAGLRIEGGPCPDDISDINFFYVSRN